MKELKASLRRWTTSMLLVILAISGAAFYTWANSLKIPELCEASKDHEKRVITLEVKQEQILKNTEEIVKTLKEGAYKCPH